MLIEQVSIKTEEFLEQGRRRPSGRSGYGRTRIRHILIELISLLSRNNESYCLKLNSWTSFLALPTALSNKERDTGKPNCGLMNLMVSMLRRNLTPEEDANFLADAAVYYIGRCGYTFFQQFKLYILSCYFNHPFSMCDNLTYLLLCISVNIRVVYRERAWLLNQALSLYIERAWL